MAPTSSPYPSGMHVTNAGSGRSSPTGPLDVLFFIGIGIVAILLIWTTGYFGKKIFALIKNDNPVSTKRSVSGCCLRRKAFDGKKINIHDIRVPDWVDTYDGFIQSPESVAPPTPDADGRLPHGLGIDFGETKPFGEHGEDNDLSSIPQLTGSVQLTRQQCRTPEAAAANSLATATFHNPGS